MKLFSAVFVFAISNAGYAASDFDPSAYPVYETCALCHGLFGDSAQTKFPKLAAQKPEYLEAQIRAFISGARSNDRGQMVNIVADLSDDEISLVVDWFASQHPPAPAPLPQGNRGEEIAEELGCESCHGQSELSGVPHLAAQHSAYLKKQMLDYRNGIRHTPAIARIHKDLLTIPDFDLGQIADYFAAQQR